MFDSPVVASTRGSGPKAAGPESASVGRYERGPGAGGRGHVHDDGGASAGRVGPRGGAGLVAQAVLVVHGVVQRRRVLLVARVVLRRGAVLLGGRRAGAELAAQRALVLVARAVRRLQVPEQPRRAGRPSLAPPRRARAAVGRDGTGGAGPRAVGDDGGDGLGGRGRGGRRAGEAPAGDAPHAGRHLQVPMLDVTADIEKWFRLACLAVLNLCSGLCLR